MNKQDENFPSLDDLLPKLLPEEMPIPEGLVTFTVYRGKDESGVSGTGVVIQGCLFANGAVAIQWLKGPDPGDTQVKHDWEKFLDTHIRSHRNKTIITFSTGKQLRFGFEETTEPAEGQQS